jgi:hypothetical protein
MVSFQTSKLEEHLRDNSKKLILDVTTRSIKYEIKSISNDSDVSLLCKNAMKDLENAIETAKGTIL